MKVASSVLAIALIGGGALAAPPVHTGILRATGWALVQEDPVERADIIVLTVDAGAAGLLEASDLVRRGVAQTVAVFADPPDAMEEELIRRGVTYDDRAARQTRDLHAMGVANVEQIPATVSGTQDESRALPEWFERRGFSSVVIVAPSDHSRRVRRVLHRTMAGHRTHVAIRYTRYSRFNPEEWWRDRTTLRTGIVELQKLVLDFALHPLS